MASIVAADLVPYNSANDLTNGGIDAATIGGAIDPLRRPVFTQMTANSTLEVVAAGATTTNITVRGRNAAGSIVTQTVALNGTTAVALGSLGTVERILQVELAATVGSGTVTVRNSSAGTVWVTIPTGERGVSAIFREGSSSTGGTINYYNKFFWKNTNGTNALLGASVSESADPTGLITHALETTVGGSGTTTNRQTLPASGITAFGNAAITLSTATGTADLASGSAIGVWLLLALATNNAAIRSTYTSQLAGSTT
jgi:hypothetical protein